MCALGAVEALDRRQSRASTTGPRPSVRVVQAGSGEGEQCPWRYDVAAALGPYDYGFWVGVTGTSADGEYVALTLSIRCVQARAHFRRCVYL